MTDTPRYLLTIRGRHSQAVSTLRDASEAYAKVRDDSGEGASTFPEGVVRAGRLAIGRVSYNGRVWQPGEWKQGDRPLYDNRI